MHASLRSCLSFALLVLVACSPKHEEQATAPEPASAPAPATSAAVAAVAREERKCSDDPQPGEQEELPRCGGMAAPQAEPSHAYRITLDNGESITACDITKPFSGKIGRGMVTMSFKPVDGKSGTVAWHFAGGGGVADTAYDYALSGPEEEMTGTFRVNAAVCGKAAGLGACAAAREQVFTSTWTRIEDCAQ